MLYKICFYLVKWFSNIFFPREVLGMENLNNVGDNFIVCSNHVSNLDPLFLTITLKKKIRFLAKVELFKNTLFALFLKKLGAIPINRGKNDSNAISIAEDILKNGEVLGIFIEGTRSRSGGFLRPTNGTTIIAKHTNALVVPVCITPFDKKKIKFFTKTKINFGSPIKISDLNINDDYREIRRGTEFIMDKIKKLR